MSNTCTELDNAEIPDLLSALQQRANHLHEQLKAYQACLQTHGKHQDVELRSFKRGIESEVKALRTASMLAKKVSEEPALDDLELEELQARRFHALRSSNLPFYEAVWTVALQCTGITALGKRVYSQGKGMSRQTEQGSNGSHRTANGQSKDEKKSAIVDIMAQDGLEWIKVSTITEKRLIFEMAKEGWEGYDDRLDSEEYDSEGPNHTSKDVDHEPAQLELVKLAKTLYAASRETRTRFKHPHVRFVLPKINEGSFDDVDAIIADVRSLGVRVVCSNSEVNTIDSITSLQALTLNNESEIQGSDHDMTALLPSPSMFSPPPTQTLNIDCTILLALISDISHIHAAALPPYPNNISGHYHKAITRQINNEIDSPLLPTEIYPLLCTRHLVCTAEAAQRMREIVQTMGTPTEAARADIFLAEGIHRSSAASILRTALTEYSRHDVPSQLQLPIQVIDFDDAASSALTPDKIHFSPLSQRIMHKTAAALPLSTINKSVFLSGWRAGLVTVTSNRVVAHGLVRCINEILDAEEEQQQQRLRRGRVTDGHDSGEDDDGIVDFDVGDIGAEFEGPLVYVCETARSLIGKEKLVKVG